MNPTRNFTPTFQSECVRRWKNRLHEAVTAEEAFEGLTAQLTLESLQDLVQELPLDPHVRDQLLQQIQEALWPVQELGQTPPTVNSHLTLNPGDCDAD